MYVHDALSTYTVVCAIPQAYFITRNISMKSCLSKEEMSCVSGTYRKIYTTQLDSEKMGCPPACRTPATNVKVTVDNTRDGGNYTQVYVSYSTTMVMVSEEYKLFDFGAIVAAVGGSLGLFLGFSCWQFIKSAVRTCQESRPRSQKVIIA